MIENTNNTDLNPQEINPVLLRLITSKLKILSIEMSDIIKTRVLKDNFLDQLSLDLSVWFDFLTDRVELVFYEVEEFLYEFGEELTTQEKKYATEYFKNEIEQLIRKNIKPMFSNL
ncbi:MAG: hypothetical protein ACRYFL_03110 [Janthinobacterium lividum]